MTGWNKSVRALFAALITTLLGLLMHVGAGGVVAPIGVAIVFILVLWTAMIMAGRRLGHLSLVSLLGLGQILMHLAMGWFISAGTAMSGSTLGHQHMNHSTGTLGLGQGTAMSHSMSHSMTHSMSHATGGGSAVSTSMVLAHVAAVLITAIVLKRGEDIILTILQLALGPIATALTALAEAVGALAEFPARLVQRDFHLPQAITAAVVGPNYRRGPPVFA